MAGNYQYIQICNSGSTVFHSHSAGFGGIPKRKDKGKRNLSYYFFPAYGGSTGSGGDGVEMAL